ncbi:MAG: serine/threonine protein kinase [Planctomycetaceae bacterium]|nr:serine/threonine protein kinase [Planctomycetaceae bacterium]
MDFQTANLLEPILLQFEDAWQDNAAPLLEEFVPEAVTEHGLASSHRPALVRELAMIDLEHRRRSGQPVTTDDYLKQFAELEQHRLPLLQFELRLRQRLHDEPTASEIATRHPDLAELLSGTVDRPSSQSHVSAGDPLIAGAAVGDFVIREHIGSGTFADVYRADDSRLNRPVALKFLKPWMHGSASLKARMLREAQAVASLQHPNVVPVYEFGDHQGRDFIASRYINGPTLSQWCQEQQPAPAQSAEMTAALALALEAAHGSGIVHRDVKPENVIIEDSQPMLLDFGLAHFGTAASELTFEGDIVGTPAYMSPEQASGIREAGPASDIYSLGVILYQMLTGQLPFDGRPSAVLQQTIHEEPEAPQRINPRIPRDLQTICLKAMSKSADDRYGSARAMADDLQRFLRHEPIAARPPGFAERCLRTARRYPVASVLALLLIVAAATTIGGYAQYRNVVRERNRATSAEDEIRSLLARDAVLSGQVAQRQGETGIAVQRYQEAIARDCQEIGEVRVSMAECQLANGTFAAARQSLDALKTLSLTSEQSARVKLVQLQLMLADQLTLPVNATELAESISATALPESSRFLLAGLSASDSVTARLQFERACEIDPHNLTARRLSALLSFLLADFERSLNVCETSELLFKGQPDFELLRAMNRAAQQDVAAARAIIRQADVSAARKQSWQTLCDDIGATCAQFDTGALRVFRNGDRGDTELNLEQLISVLVRIRRDYHGLASENQWYLPPAISAAFEDFLFSSDEVLKADQATGFVASLASVFSGDGSEHSAAMKRLIAAHPEPTLKTTLARDALDRWGTTTANLTYVQQLFETSLHGSSFLEGTDNQAKVGAFLAAMGLARVEKVRVEQNSARASALLQTIDPQQIDDAAMLRILSLTPLQEQASWDVAEKFIGRWVEVSSQQENRSMQLDALWTQAVLHKNQQRWYRVLAECDVILESFSPQEWQPPMNPEGLKIAAVTQLIQAVQVEGADFDWPRVLLDALHKRQWALAAAALAELDAAVQDPAAVQQARGQQAVAGQSVLAEQTQALRTLFDALQQDNSQSAHDAIRQLQNVERWRPQLQAIERSLEDRPPKS